MENDMNLSTSRITRLLAFAGSLGLAAGLVAACSNSVAPTTNNIVAAAAASVPVMITDAPSDQLASFSLTLNTITLTDSAGKTVSVLSTPTTVEICHLNGIQAPLVTASIPQDTYTSATITFSNPQITYISATAAPVVSTPTLATTSFTFNFPAPGFTVNNTSTSLLVDLLAGQSVAISGTTVTVTPTFVLKPVPPAAGTPPMGQNGTGMQLMGSVVSSTATSLAIQAGLGPTFMLTTNSSTILQGFTSLTALTAGQLVEVDFTLQSGGVLLASRIELEPTPPNGLPQNLLAGPITSVTPGTSFKMVVMQGLGPTAMPVAASAVTSFTVTTNSSTTWNISPQFVALTGLPFTPSFSATNVSAGQNVGVAATGISGNTATAAAVNLIPQTLGGTVSAVTPAGAYTAYTLTLNSGSAFATLSGASTITVYTGTATAGPVGVTAPPAIVVGSNVRFNGLVFNLGGGKFAMVAACSPDGAPGI
jgi:Domain of unknown function (DUF5666)